MLKPKLVLEYVKKYSSEMAKLVSNASEECRILLPDHIVSSQEIEIYVTKETGVAINYIGMSKYPKITIYGSDRCFDDLVFPPTEHSLPCSQGSIELKPLSKTGKNDPITTLSFLGDMKGIVLFKIVGGGHLFSFDKQLMASNFGRHVIFNIYVQREYSDGNLVSKYVRYAELYPNKNELFTSAKAVANARKDFEDYSRMVKSEEFGPQVQKYVRIGQAVHQLKKDSVVVLGKDTPLLGRIRDELCTIGYNAFLVKNQPDIPEQSAEEKVKLYTLMAKFAVMEDSSASGHIAEFEYCKNNRVVLTMLRQKGKGSTWMIGDASLVDLNYINVFEYDEKNLHTILVDASKWAESFIQRRKESYHSRLS
jgi:hypothetical protein